MTSQDRQLRQFLLLRQLPLWTPLSPPMTAGGVGAGSCGGGDGADDGTCCCADPCHCPGQVVLAAPADADSGAGGADAAPHAA